MKTVTRYPTAPIQVWQKMKELRRWHGKHAGDAKKRGDLVVQGVVEAYLALFSGFGDFANPTYGPYFTQLQRNEEQLQKVLEATERRGYSREICSSMRCHLGQLFTGIAAQTVKGEPAMPDVLFQFNNCHSMVKTGQLFSEELGVPYYVLDVPYKHGPAEVEYNVQCLFDAIEWMEKATARKFDDEKFLEGVNIEWEASALFSRVCELQKNIPAPFDMRQLWSLRLPLVTMRYRQECLEYTRELLAEAEERVEKGISARGFETARFTQEGIPPFYHIKVLRYPAEYGAVFVGGEILFSSFGCWEWDDDGHWKVPLTPRERGWKLKTREDGVRALVDLYLLHHPLHRFCHSEVRPKEFIARVRDWRCDGAVLHLDRGCKGYQTGMIEAKLAFHQAGIPCATYESSQADCRDFDQTQVYDGLDSFFESLGLRKLQLEGQKEETE